MAMLEDQITKQSVWDGDDDDVRPEEGEEAALELELEENQTLDDVLGPEKEAPYVPPNRPGRKTGPKGVLADKRAHEKEKRKEAERDMLKAKAMVHRAGHGVTRVDGSVSVAATAAAHAAALREEVDIDTAHEARAAAEEAPDAPSSPAPEDEEDAAFLAEYRQRRLAELAAGPPGPYGEVTLVKDASHFLDEINDAPKGVFVVVHMWESFVPECGAVSAALAPLAAAATHVKFLSVISSVVKRNFDPIALPAFMIYLNGGTFATEVRVTDFMVAGSGGVSAAAIAELLVDMGVPAPLLSSAGAGTEFVAADAPAPAAAAAGGGAGPVEVRRHSLRPSAAVPAFAGAGSSVSGSLTSATDAGFDDMD